MWGTSNCRDRMDGMLVHCVEEHLLKVVQCDVKSPQTIIEGLLNVSYRIFNPSRLESLKSLLCDKEIA